MFHLWSFFMGLSLGCFVMSFIVRMFVFTSIKRKDRNSNIQYSLIQIDSSLCLCAGIAILCLGLSLVGNYCF